MALNFTHFDVYPISPKSNWVAHPDSGYAGGILKTIKTFNIFEKHFANFDSTSLTSCLNGIQRLVNGNYIVCV